MTRQELTLEFAKAAMQARCHNWPIGGGQDSLQSAVSGCWTIARAMVEQLPAWYLGQLEDDPLPALEDSRVEVLVSEGHAYCEKPWTIKHVDKPDEVRGGPQCERCAQLTKQGAEALTRRLEIRENRRKAQRREDFRERAREAREADARERDQRRRKRGGEEGDDDGAVRV